MARCPTHEDTTPSLSITDTGSTILVHCHAGCSQGDVIEALRARGLWPEREHIDQKPFAAEERAAWSRRQRMIERELPQAERWHRAAVAMLEQVLTTLKSALFDPTAGPADSDAVWWHEQYLARLQRLDGAPLVGEYQIWKRDYTALTRAMVRAVVRHEQAELRALAAYWEQR
jgi:hypothetical protein